MVARFVRLRHASRGLEVKFGAVPATEITVRSLTQDYKQVLNFLTTIQLLIRTHPLNHH